MAADETTSTNSEMLESNEYSEKASRTPNESNQAAQNNHTAPPNNTAQRGKKPVCRFFKTKSCKYGAKGAGCQYLHPQKCLSYLKHGTKGKRGCKKGDKCDRYHPKLCFDSANRGVCTREDCKYHHLKGTRRTEPEMRQTYAHTLLEENPGGLIHAPAHPKHVAPRRMDDAPGNADLQAAQNQANFETVQHQIQQMQRMQSQLLNLIQKSFSAQSVGPGTGCIHCQQKC